MRQSVLIWDVPTRVFHWSLAGSFAGAFYISDSERYRDIHVMLGYIFLALIVFRVLWGLIGTRYARFNSFWFSPGEVWAYTLSLLKRNSVHYLGHNPAGSVAIWLLLLSGLVSGVTGVMALEDIGGDRVVEWHDLVSEGMLAIIALHVLGVVVSSVMHRENLARAMVTGIKSGEAKDGIEKSYAWLGVLIVIAMVLFWFMYPTKG